jgi:hypothetical protein
LAEVSARPTDPVLKDRREILKQRPQLLARQTVFKALKEDPQIALEYLDRVSGSNKC